MKRVLILGGGFGGIATAVALRARLDPADEIILVDRRTSFVMGLRKNWVLAGESSLAEGTRGLADLERRGITVAQGDVTAIHPADRAADVDGRRLEADVLVVALGAERDVERVPGFREFAIDAYDPAATARGREAIERLTAGRVVIGIFGVPYPCPPAPFELAMLLASALRSGAPGQWSRSSARCPVAADPRLSRLCHRRVAARRRGRRVPGGEPGDGRGRRGGPVR